MPTFLLSRHNFDSTSIIISLFLLLSIISPADSWALDPQHQVAGSYGGTRLYANDSVIISPSAKSNLYSQTTTEVSTSASNAIHKDVYCRSITNTSTKDYFIPWRSDTEWQAFLKTASAGSIQGVRVNLCCYPRINPNVPCKVSYALGNRNAGARPTDASNDPQAPSAEVTNYGAEGDVSNKEVGYNRKQTWTCQSGEWIYTRDEGGCFRDGHCNNFDVTNPSGLNGASVSAIPSSNRDTLMCNGVNPTAISGGVFPYPESVAPPPYGTAGWSWICSGQQGGSSEQCHANYNGGKMNGVCGKANYSTTATAPINPNLCYVGTPSVVTGPLNNKWAWSCAGVNGGSLSNCTASVPTPTKAACGSYGASGRPTGLLAMELTNGIPAAAGLCSGTGTTLEGSVNGNGTLASPWTWTCYNSTSNTSIGCTNKFTAIGKCGLSNGSTLPSAPNYSTNMCDSGRWYSKVISGSSNSVVWNAATNKWTWACMGHNQTTGEVRNDLCEAGKCLECTGTENQAVSIAFQGHYNECPLESGAGVAKFTKPVIRQNTPSDVIATIAFGNGGYGTVQLPTTVATGYCPPCYRKAQGVVSGSVELNSACVFSPPRTFSATITMP